MQRARLSHIVKDAAGNVVRNASVTVRQTGTAVNITDTMYAADTGATTTPNPLISNAQGEILAFFQLPGTHVPGAVDLLVTDNTNTAYYPLDPAELLSFTDFTETAIVEPPTSPVLPAGVLYVHPSGSNSNDGLTWATAKKDVVGAYDTLPASGGTIYFTSGSYVDATNTDRGLWLGGANDSQYASLPTGWRQQKAAFVLIGVQSGYAGGTHSVAAILNGGSPTDVTKPLFWFAGCNQHIEIRNVTNLNLARPMILGLDSTGSGHTNNAGFEFNKLNLRANQDVTFGPVVDITSVYWCWFRDCTFSANEQATYDSDNRAGVLIRGSGLGEGLIWFRSTQFNGGCGVKQYSSASVNSVLDECVQEGPSTGDLSSAPIYWLASKLPANSTPGHVHVLSIEQADAGAIPYGTVKVATGNDPSIVVVHGAQSVQGPATVLSRYASSVSTMTTSPIGHRQTGFYRGRVFGRTDAARRLGTPVSPHVANLAPQAVSAWGALTGAAVVTTGKRDPYGGTNAAELTGAAAHRVLYAATPSPAAAVGDWVVGAIWMKRVGSDFPTNRPQFNIAGTGNLFDMGNGTTGTNVSLDQPWIGDSDWVWVIEARKISALPAAVTFTMNIYSDTSKAMQYAYPVLAVIPTANYSDSEALAMVESMSPWSDDAAVTAGELTTLKQQTLHALGGLKVGGSLTLPTFTTAGRPAGASGQIIYDSDVDEPMVHDGTAFTRTRSLWIRSVDMSNNGDGTSAFAVVGAAPDGRDVWGFDAATTEGVVFTQMVPGDWTAGSAMNLYLYYIGTTDFGATESVRWRVSRLHVGSLALIDAAATQVTRDDDPGVNADAQELVISPAFALGTPAAARDIIRVDIARFGAHANDDYAGAVHLVGARLDYTANR